MMAFHLWSFQLSILKSVMKVFFARLTHSTSQFDKTVLNKCVTHVGFDRMTWALRGIPFWVGTGNLDLTLNLQLSIW